MLRGELRNAVVPLTVGVLLEVLRCEMQCFLVLQSYTGTIVDMNRLKLS